MKASGTLELPVHENAETGLMAGQPMESSWVQMLLGVTLVMFMVGSLFEVGLRLNVTEAFAAIRNVRFVCLSILWAFFLCPALAVLLTRIIPLTEPYATGLILLSMTPCAPFFPTVAQ